MRLETFFEKFDQLAYALLACPVDPEKKRNMEQRLADAHITSLWYPEGEHEHVEEILQLLLD